MPDNVEVLTRNPEVVKSYDRLRKLLKARLPDKFSLKSFEDYLSLTVIALEFKGDPSITMTLNQLRQQLDPESRMQSALLSKIKTQASKELCHQTASAKQMYRGIEVPGDSDVGHSEVKPKSGKSKRVYRGQAC